MLVQPIAWGTFPVIHLPTLSEEDRAVKSEGSLDPLSLYSISDSLAVRLVPGVRERQAHPRFLTATAASLAICSTFDEDTVSADGVSPPSQVFEWYLVEGLVRTVKDSAQNRGLPGQDKVSRTLRDRVPLSANRYLKTPTVFGFHGVYRVLAKMVNIEIADSLGETGYDLLQTWAEEQGLAGFYGSTSGPGSTWRRQLTDAVAEGLEKGHVSRSAGWRGWSFFRDHLGIYGAGSKERATLAEALTRQETGHLREIWSFLTSAAGWKLWEESKSERAIHTELLSKSSPHLRHMLETIQVYETFSRLLQDAFEDCLLHMSRKKARTPAPELFDLDSVHEASTRIPDLYAELLERLTTYQEAVRFQDIFSAFSEAQPAYDWVVTLLEHHIQVQSKKPPNGKAPWFERFDDDSYVIRPGYIRAEGGRHDDSYVHAYRCQPLVSFASDLGQLN